MGRSPYSSPLSCNTLTWELSHSISSYLMCTCYVPDVIFLALWWYPVSITMSDYIRFDWFPVWKCQVERTIYERSEWMNEWMLKCCSPFYQEVSVLEHCYWFFSSQMHSVTFFSKHWSLLSIIPGALGKSPLILHTRVAAADCWRPINLTERLRGSCHTCTPGPLCFFAYFWKLKLGHIVWQWPVSRWRQKGGKSIWNWGFLRTLGEVAASPQPDSCRDSAHATPVWCADTEHPYSVSPTWAKSPSPAPL